MKKGVIGVMLMMVKHDIQKYGIYSVMKRLKDMGYNVVEVSQIEMHPEFVSELKRSCKELDMQIGALSCGVDHLSPTLKFTGDTLAHEFDKIVRDSETLGCTTQRIGSLPRSTMEYPEMALHFLHLCEEYAQKLKAYGIHLYFHPHHAEMRRVNGRILLDIMREETECLGFELDTHWLWRGGVDPEKYVRKFAGRIHLMHLKDYRIGSVDFSAYPVPEADKWEYMMKDIVQFAEVGEGTLDMPAIIHTAVECGAKYFHIEQDDFYGRDPYESIQLSHDNLVKMGFGDWF